MSVVPPHTNSFSSRGPQQIQGILIMVEVCSGANARFRSGRVRNRALAPEQTSTMMRIPCICCGPRDENEFVCGGTTDIQRPALDASDETWGSYLFFRDNPKGMHLE